MSESQENAQDCPENSEVNGSADLQNQIRARAYELYVQRGGEHGYAEQDWLQAEAEILAANVPREASVSTIAREKSLAFTASRRQAAVNRAARFAEKARAGQD